MFGRILATLALAGCASHLASQTASEAPLTSTDTHSSDIVRYSAECEKWDVWDKPAQPFQIHANTYYVGTCGIAAILVTGEDGHILIDTGTREGAEIVARNIAALGFKLSDVDLILTSHEHFDHVGGLGYMQQLTGAKVIVPVEAISQIAQGITPPDDPQFGIHPDTEPVASKAISLLVRADGDVKSEEVKLSDIYLIPHRTPGHTAGALTWQWQSCDAAGCKTLVYADSLSPVSRDDYRFSDHPEYLANFRASIERLGGLDCDILLTPHPSHSKMIERAATGTFEGGMTCAEYADSKTSALDARLAEEAAAE